MTRTFLKRNIWLLCSSILVLCLVISWILYGLFSSKLIETAYRGESIGILNALMKGRAVTPLKDYYEKADRLMVVSTFSVVALFLILSILFTNPFGAVLVCFSCIFAFSLLFFFLELFPLGNPIPLDFIDYYAYRANYIPDDKLVHRDRPLVKAELHNFRGVRYSPVYKIDVAPTTIDWTTDEEGFRSSHQTRLADVIVIGDSFIEYGDNEADIFTKRLEQKLSGLIVANLGKSGYGPFQYLEVLKRYGIHKQPKIALFGFYAGNDLNDIKNYLEWERGEGNSEYVKVYTALTGNILQRYIAALTGVVHYIQRQISLLVEMSISTMREMRGFIHPSIAVLDLGANEYKVLFIDRHREKSTEDLLHENQTKELKNILKKFKTICENHDIIPILLYIPTSTQIYADYSTMQSGSAWLRVRQEQIQLKKHRENALISLSQELNLELINLSNIFERAAAAGKMTYYALDSHWNAAGRELGASFVAHTLQEKFLRPSSGEIKK
jgi:hypothetical protein